MLASPRGWGVPGLRPVTASDAGWAISSCAAALHPEVRCLPRDGFPAPRSAPLRITSFRVARRSRRLLSFAPLELTAVGSLASPSALRAPSLYPRRAVPCSTPAGLISLTARLPCSSGSSGTQAPRPSCAVNAPSRSRPILMPAVQVQRRVAPNCLVRPSPTSSDYSSIGHFHSHIRSFASQALLGEAFLVSLSGKCSLSDLGRRGPRHFAPRFTRRSVRPAEAGALIKKNKFLKIYFSFLAFFFTFLNLKKTGRLKRSQRARQPQYLARCLSHRP